MNEILEEVLRQACDAFPVFVDDPAGRRVFYFRRGIKTAPGEVNVYRLAFRPTPHEPVEGPSCIKIDDKLQGTWQGRTGAAGGPHHEFTRPVARVLEDWACDPRPLTRAAAVARLTGYAAARKGDHAAECVRVFGDKMLVPPLDKRGALSLRYRRKGGAVKGAKPMVMRKVSATGVITYWNTSTSSITRLRDACAAASPGLEKLLPVENTPLAALRKALETCYPSGDYLVRRTRGNGYVAVRETKDGASNKYTVVARARFDEETGLMRAAAATPEERKAIFAAYHGSRDTLEPGDLGSFLSKAVARHLGGTNLRPRTGGVYWLPEDRAAKWEEVARAAEAASTNGGTTVHTLRHNMDAAVVRAVQDAITAEIGDAATELEAAILSGKLGPRALARKERQVKELLAKTKSYERILDTGLGGVRKLLDKVTDAAAAAALLASVEADGEAATVGADTN